MISVRIADLQIRIECRFGVREITTRWDEIECVISRGKILGKKEIFPSVESRGKIVLLLYY